MPSLDRIVAGLSCREVLASLSDFLDGALSAARLAAVRGHLAECRECDRLGADVAWILGALRGSLATPSVLAPEMATRLRSRLARERSDPE